MIGRLTGKIIEKQPPNLLIDVQGVGYEVAVSMRTMFQLPDSSDSLVGLYTHLVVREDAQLLYGFYDVFERELFRALIKVNGVGPKMAITLLSKIAPEDFIRCVREQDSSGLVKLPGVGKKTAERLLIEMRDRIVDLPGNHIAMPSESATMVNDFTHRARQDAVSALVALGYKLQTAQQAIKQIKEDDLTTQALIRIALQQI